MQRGTVSTVRPKGNKLATALGVHPSELGALNALNASPNAFANASPTSRVGRIAAYRQQSKTVWCWKRITQPRRPSSTRSHRRIEPFDDIDTDLADKTHGS